MTRTAAENAEVQKIQKRAQKSGQIENWSLMLFRMVEDARKAVRNDGAYWLRRGLSGCSMIACA